MAKTPVFNEVELVIRMNGKETIIYKEVADNSLNSAIGIEMKMLKEFKLDMANNNLMSFMAQNYNPINDKGIKLIP